MFMSNLLIGFGVYSGGFQTPSYANAGGTGDRTSSITATTTLTLASGSGSDLVNNVKGLSGFDPDNSQAVTGLYVRFDFVTPRLITEVKFFASSSNAEGNFKWQGSSDASSWTDLSSAFSMVDGTAGSGAVVGDISANTTGYRYYQALGTSSTTFGAGGPYWQEFEFKIGNPL